MMKKCNADEDGREEDEIDRNADNRRNGSLHVVFLPWKRSLQQ